MKIGISTYAYRWEWEFTEHLQQPLSLRDMVDKTNQFGAEVFQICDYPLLEKMSDAELGELKAYAESKNVELEVGTQGIEPGHLENYLRIAKAVGSKVLRTMVHDKVYQPSIEQAEKWLAQVAPLFEEADVQIALETYEPVKTADLVRIIKALGSSHVGICLDPGNSISELEFPDDVIRNTAPYTTNVHFKDFVFKRREGSIGFYLLGSPVGEGQLNLDFLLETLKKENIDVNGVIEMWLPFTETIDKTIELQNEWIQRSVNNLKEKLAVSSVAAH